MVNLILKRSLCIHLFEILIFILLSIIQCLILDHTVVLVPSLYTDTSNQVRKLEYDQTITQACDSVHCTLAPHQSDPRWKALLAYLLSVGPF